MVKMIIHHFIVSYRSRMCNVVHTLGYPCMGLWESLSANYAYQLEVFDLLSWFGEWEVSMTINPDPGNE